jgi:hypothetical protein
MIERLTRQETQAICDRVYRRFPAMDGVRPSIKRQKARGGDQFLLRFEAVVSLSDGAQMATTVRVVTNADGKILKMTSSR